MEISPKKGLRERVRNLSPEDKRFYFGVVPFVSLAVIAWNVLWAIHGLPQVSAGGDLTGAWLWALTASQQRDH